ncbi:MAG: LysR substrate-binding domain-containing protein, partial [Caulobacterales bacterium]|nr:LysR substrate-binding domain-containing protein [Caulobacterales bacterium]
ERPVMALYSPIGTEGNLLDETEAHARMIRVEHPVITNEELEALREIDEPGFASRTLSCLFKVADGGDGLRGALDKLCAEAEQAVRDDEDEPQGELAINAPMSFGVRHLGPAVADFMARWPKLRVRMELSDRFIDPVAEGFDMTVRIAEPAEAPSLIDHQIVEARRVICAAPALVERLGEPDHPSALAELPCLHYGNLATGNVWRLSGPEGPADVRVNGVLCSNAAEVLRDAAVRGLGFALLPTFVAGPDLQAGRLATVLADFTPPRIFLCLLYPPHRHLSARVRLFVDFMHERFADRPHWDLVT